MNTPLWMPHAAVSHHADTAYGRPVLSANAAGDRTQLSADAIQFGFCVYEGMRVYVADGRYLVFRARDHHERLARSCAALAMPCPSYDVFVEAIGLVVEANLEPDATRLYIRPIVFSTGGGIMPQQDQSFTYAVLCTTFEPTVDGLKVLVETENPRTVPAFAAVKTATNYTSSALVTRQAQNLGYDTVLWTDGDGYLRECTTMNVFLCVDGEILTPRLGGILPGVTRRTVIELLAGQGVGVVERDVHITELVDAAASGGQSCVFTTSTALGINIVTLLRHGEDEYKLSAEWSTAVAAAKESYRTLTREFPSVLSKYGGIAERSHIGAIQPRRGRE